jgi:putative SOS response-associated peptidase YedK
MCYHKQDIATEQELVQRYGAVLRDISIEPVYYENGFDFKASPVLTASNPKEFQLLNWGLIPWWTKSAADGAQIRMRTLNCISEEMFEKPAFKDSIQEGKRCLIPSNGAGSTEAKPNTLTLSITGRKRFFPSQAFIPAGLISRPGKNKTHTVY